MRNLVLMTAIGMAMLAAGPAAAARPDGEALLAQLLRGRVAGEPVDCVPFGQARDLRVINRTAIVYGRGRVIYVNRPTNADTLDRDDVLVSDDSQNGRSCKLDTLQMRDRSGGWYKGFVGLERFTPYRRAN